VPCPDANALAAYLAGEEADDVRRHLGACVACREVVLALGASASPGDAPPAAVERGAIVGRYLVLERIGQGGMGVVFAAYDPELDRRVALKLIRADGASGGGGRLVREARAQARIAHPNVVAVHDVGTLDGDRVFVAMELVAGETLREWLRRPRAPREVLAMFLAAGRGLAAAHAAGVVHRDFKPDNVIVGGDGRPRITDFGLARAAAAAPEPGTDATLADTVTRGGVVAGTPAYMAPEQLRGEPATAASDQFSFCAALFEGLHGARPFTGRTTEELLGAIERGRPEPSGRAPPPLLRGLSPRPEDRFPTLDALLAALDPEPRARRRRAAMIGLGVCAVGAAAFLARPAAAPLCRGAERELAGAWDGARRDALRRTFAASGRPYGADALRTVEQGLDRYAAAWIAMHQDACEATHVRGEQSAQLLDLRMACLERRRGELAAATELLARDPGVVDKAVHVVSDLEPLASCEDTAGLQAVAPPPASPALRARSAAIRVRVDAARALDRAGRYAEALGLATAAAIEARRAADPGLAADALFVLGVLQRETDGYAAAEDTLRESALAAARARDDRAVARAAAELYAVLAVSEDHAADAARWLGAADVALVRAGDDPLQRAELLASQGIAEGSASSRLLARVHLTAALALRLQVLGPMHLDVARAWKTLAQADYIDGDLARARRDLENARQVMSALLGSEHPSLAGVYSNLGVVAHAQGDQEGARAYDERALAIGEAALGPDHADVAVFLNNLASLALEAGDAARARALLTRVLAIRLRALGPDHSYVGSARLNLASALDLAGEPEAALRECSEALRIFAVAPGVQGAEVQAFAGHLQVELGRRAEAEASFGRALALVERAGAAHPDSLRALVAVAGGELQLGAVDRAAELYERLRAITATSAPDSSFADTALVGLGRVALARGRRAAARPLLERGLAMRERRHGDLHDLADARLALAQALWPEDPARARALAAEAERAFAAGPTGWRRDAEEARAWLREKR
jgi:eukaryotic-like serine/threonine-protein kinase